MQLSNSFDIELVGTAMVVRFARPEIRNPLSVEVLAGLTKVIGTLDEDIRAIVFTGSKDVFASGADLREIAGVKGSTAAEFAVRGQRLMNLIQSIDARTVAAVNGYCFGGALDLALACDRRIASANALFCHPGAGLGIMTGWGGTQRLPRLVGEAAAMEMFLMGMQVSAEQALNTGLIDQINADPVRAAIEVYL